MSSNFESTFFMAVYFYKHDPGFRACVDKCFDLDHPDPAVVEQMRSFYVDGKTFSLM